MKRSIRMILLAAVLLLSVFSGCNKPEKEDQEAIQPFLFYYRTAQTSFSDESGLIRAEERDLGAKTYSVEELFPLYFEGPVSSQLVSPVPSGTTFQSVERSGSQLNIYLRQNYTSQSGIDHSILDACLAKTGLQIDGVRRVRVRVESMGGQTLRDNTFSASDILLFDSGETIQQTELLLYFSDSNHRWLLTEKRTIPYLDPEKLPEYVVDQLIQGPQTPGMVSALPPGTDRWEVTVDNGICAVDFNEDFYRNRPSDEQAEQLVLLSVVNSLCELDGVNQVQFYVEGRKIQNYQHLNISTPYSIDTSVVGPIREELNEFEGTLCLPGQNDHLLHTLSVRVRIRGNISKEESLIQALFGRPSQNGLRNPMEGMQLPNFVAVTGAVCQVDLSKSALSALDDETRQEVLRSILATLYAQEGIRHVTISADGEPLTEVPNQPDSSWFCTPGRRSFRYKSAVSETALRNGACFQRSLIRIDPEAG